MRCLEEFSDHIAAIGEVVSDVHKVAVLLQSVQDSYPTLVTALLASPYRCTLMFALLDEEQRRGRTIDPGSADATLRSNRRFGSKKWKNSTCFNLDTLLEIALSVNQSLPKGITS